MRAPTQKDEVLTYLQQWGSITALEGFTRLYVVDLAGVIRNLRKVYIIDDEWIHKENFYGRPIKYKRYLFKGKKTKK